MNLYAPQSTRCRVEIDILTNLKYHIISPKYASPIISLKQDSLMGVYLFTNFDTSYNRLDTNLFLSNIRMTKQMHDKYKLLFRGKSNKIEFKDIISILFDDSIFYENASQNVLIEKGLLKKGVFNKKLLEVQKTI